MSGTRRPKTNPCMTETKDNFVSRICLFIFQLRIFRFEGKGDHILPNFKPIYGLKIGNKTVTLDM